MDEKEPQEEKKFKISDLYNNKRYYAIANLAFYGILIICLIIFLRGIPDPIEKNNKNKQNENTIQSSVDGFSNIKAKNFNVKYTLVYDNNMNVYTGKQYNNLISFAEESKSYFYQDGLFFEKENDKYVLSEFELKYFDFFDVDTIEKILSESEKENDNLIITKEKLTEVLGKEINIEKISITLTKLNGVITKIKFEISELSPMSMKPTIFIEYSDFGLVEEFSIKNN